MPPEQANAVQDEHAQTSEEVETTTMVLHGAAITAVYKRIGVHAQTTSATREQQRMNRHERRKHAALARRR